MGAVYEDVILSDWSFCACGGYSNKIRSLQFSNNLNLNHLVIVNCEFERTNIVVSSSYELYLQTSP